MTKLPKFSVKAHCTTRYWLLWLGIGALWFGRATPYPVIYKLGCALGHWRDVMAPREIAYRSSELCFPEMTAQERRTMVVKNFESSVWA